MIAPASAALPATMQLARRLSVNALTAPFESTLGRRSQAAAACPVLRVLHRPTSAVAWNRASTTVVTSPLAMSYT